MSCCPFHEVLGQDADPSTVVWIQIGEDIKGLVLNYSLEMACVMHQAFPQEVTIVPSTSVSPQWPGSLS